MTGFVSDDQQATLLELHFASEVHAVAVQETRVMKLVHPVGCKEKPFDPVQHHNAKTVLQNKYRI